MDSYEEKKAYHNRRSVDGAIDALVEHRKGCVAEEEEKVSALTRRIEELEMENDKLHEMMQEAKSRPGEQA